MYATVVTLFCIFSNFMVLLGRKCSDQPIDNSPRIFYTIKSFQNDSITFDANVVVFRTKGIENLDADIFRTDGAYFIRELKLNANNIQNIDDNAFLPVQCVEKLELQNNNISHITNVIFLELSILRILNLSHNSLKEIPDYAFAYNKNLRNLFLSNNKITTLNTYSFRGMGKLDLLDLSYNRLTVISPENFSLARHLNVLNLAFNRITNLQIHMFNLRELADLNLAGNYLKILDFDHKFEFEFSLTNLNLSHNHLTQLNPYQLIRAIQVLFKLDLSGNRLYCEQLWHMVSILEKARIQCMGPRSGTTHVRGIDCLYPTRISVVYCVIFCLLILVVVAYIMFYINKRILSNCCKRRKTVQYEGFNLS